MSGEEDERWHVRMAPGEVKLLTLDQIDDLFRLEVIDGDTFLRQEGSKNWVPLRVVAGLDDEASEEVESALPSTTGSAPSPPPLGSAPPPPPSARSAPSAPLGSAPPPPPSARSAPSAPLGSAPPPPPPARSAPPPPPAPLPPPSEAAPSAPAPLPPPSVAAPSVPAPSVAAAPAPSPPPSVATPFAHSPSFMPPPPSSRGRAAPPSAPAPSVAPPAIASVAPLPLSPPALLSPPLRPSRVEPLLIGLAALLGLIVALQRNGALATLFASAGQGAAYARLEASLGGPGFGTPRAVDALVRQTRALPPSAAATPRGVNPGARPK